MIRTIPQLTKKLNSQLPKIFVLLFIFIIFISSISSVVSASHSWGGYHWARQTSSFNLKLSSNLSTAWQSYLLTASTDWSQPDVLDTLVVKGSRNSSTCRPTLGQVEVCNWRYGSNGWLGLAQIWVSGNHITQATTKMNDTYFNKSRYNKPEEKNHVMCQEIGHTLGLAHQDESGLTLNTCMDYSNSLTSQHPNAHDYELLSQLYAHLDSTTTVGVTKTASAAAQDGSDKNLKKNWGKIKFKSNDIHQEIYEKTFNDGSKIVSAVYWAENEH
jgi:hypothetical protein